MKKYISKISLFVITLSLLASSCEKQLEIDPRQSIDAATALTSRDAIEASITGVYARLKNVRQYGRDLIALPEALADNGFATNKSGRLLPEAQNNIGATFTGAIWSNSYAAINQINLTLEAIPLLTLVPEVSATERNRWEGELYFLRSLYYFDLVRVYAYIPGATVSAQDKGGVPISVKGLATDAAALAFKPSRAPQAEVFKLITDDLILANARLTNPGLGSSRANKSAAQGLLSRVHLYNKNYAAAKVWADSSILASSTRLTTTANYVANWRGETNVESLFQIRYASAAENIGVNESLQTSFSTLVSVGNRALTGGFGDLVPTLSLLTDLGIVLAGGNTSTTNFGVTAAIASRSGDVRNLLYELGTTGRGPAKVETTKYLGKNGFVNLDNIPVLRISEIYLNRAEAFATPGSSALNLAGALEDLKTIKSRRYENYTGSMEETADNAAGPAALYEEILRQRRIEFAFEGHRFFDLKRLGRELVKGPHYNNVAFTDVRILPPIPQRDVDGNSNLIQNSGY